ncbi:MAG TPA: hypothetical protein VNL71_23335 [Chloroflexota bacterium]|nr:hypothetical protein [Chloroflexota bacterium]
MASAASARSFAGLLEDYAAPQSKFPPQRETAFDALEDDVATLTYEHALKAHARYHPQPDPVPPQPDASILRETALPFCEAPALPRAFAPAQPASAPRKSSSITLRLTAEEDERLRARAAEAGLTVSAYLRSCAFEVESLRAQVKQAVAKLRQPGPPPPAPRRNWLARFWSWARRKPVSDAK